MKSEVFILLALIIAGQSESFSQTPDNLVLQGRSFLGVKDLTNANSRFAAAVAISPNHQTANALNAATRLLSWPYRRPVQDMMDRLGVTTTNRDVYKWTAKIPRDTNGVPVPPNNFNAMEAVAFVRTNLLVEVSASLNNLSKVTDKFFVLNLTSNETRTGPITMDYGDVQMLRSFLYAAEFGVYTLNNYNFSAQLNTLYHLRTRGELTLSRLLDEYPLALTFITTNDFGAAKDSFRNAVDTYLVGSDIIRGRPTNMVRLFNYDPAMSTNESRFRQTLIELKASLNSLQSLTYITNKKGHLKVELGRALDGAVPPRAFLPRIGDNGIVLGSLPDPTFHGLIFGLSEFKIYEFLASSFDVSLLSNFTTIRRLPNGRLQMDLNVAADRNYGIEVSVDLLRWTQIATALSTNGILTFAESGALSFPQRFYRAVDLSEFASFEGHVSDGSTGKPLTGAVISSSLDSSTTVTDLNGNFLLQTRHATRRIGFYSLLVKADGYSLAQVEGFFTRDNQMRNVNVEAFMPPTVTSHPKNHEVPAGGSATFAVTVLGSSPLSYQWMFNGKALNAGTNSTLSLQNIQVAQAGDYSVIISNRGGRTTSQTAILLVLAAPMIVFHPTNQTVAAGSNTSFFTDATGTPPLYYQWRFNGLIIPQATNSTLSIVDAKGVNAGTYSVLVSNVVGSVSSRGAVLFVLASTAPAITSQPEKLTRVIGQSASFTVVATGNPPPTYQWFRNGISISGATTAKYSLMSVTSASAGTYSVLVRNEAGSVISQGAVLTVNTATAPTIAAQPQSLTKRVGQSASFTVIASGTAPLSYQWRKGGTSIAGATSATYSIPSVTSASVGTYTVRVTNSVGTITSQGAVLTVNP